MQWFIAAGYLRPNENLRPAQKGPAEKFYPMKAIAQLEKSGFCIVKQVCAVATLLGFNDPEVETYPTPLAFVAYRP